MKTIPKLINEALKSRKNSYSPYSKFQVGAAAISTTGENFTGCNIENSSYSGTVCGERTAIFKGVSSGATKFTAIAIVGGVAGEEPSKYCAPCGICRQVLSEFADPEICQIILGITPEKFKIYTLRELLPLIDPPSNTGNPAELFLG